MPEKDSQPLPAGRARLVLVLQAARNDFVRIDDAVRALGETRAGAAKLLSRWAKQGWLRRVGRGAYAPVPLEMLDAEQVIEDPWVLVPVLFDPGYVGGRTAAEYWDLTEQIFRDIVVFTTRAVRHRSLERQGVVFTVKRIREEALFGTRSVWRGRSRVAVSDVHRTIVDMLDDPAAGGGIEHVSDCLGAYLRRRDRDPAKLIAYADRLGNGAIFKRLGFLAERDASGAEVVAAARDRLTQGHAKLDPAIKCPRLVTRWRLRVPQSWIGAESDDRQA